MNKRAIFIIIFFLPFLAEAGIPGSPLYRLHYENSLGEKGVTTFQYDIHGLPYKAIWELLDGTRWSQNYYSFDAHGNQTRKYREFSDGITLDQHFRYDSLDRLVFEDFNRSDGRTGQTTHEYDGQGRLIRSVCQNHKGYINGEILYHFDEQGIMTGATIRDQGKITGKIEYSYDPEGRLEQEYWDFTGSWNQTFRYEYRETGCPAVRYSSPFLKVPCGTRIAGEEYSWNGGPEYPSGYEYDAAGNLSRKTYRYGKEFKTVTEYSYDGNGRLVSAHREYSDGKTADFLFRYDENGLMTEKSYTRSDGARGSETYSYNEHGILTKATLENTDGWISGSIIFTADRYDRIASGAFTGKSMPGAMLEFSYDGQDLLTGIAWRFDDGRNQAYTFRYTQD